MLDSKAYSSGCNDCKEAACLPDWQTTNVCQEQGS